MATAVPAEIAEAIANAYRRLGDNVAVAVRSEDAGDSSFAGMNATFTNVIGLHNVLARVKDCWASLYGERVLTFNVLQSCRPRLDPCAVDAAQVAVAEALTAEAYDTAAVQTEVVAARGAVALAEGDAATALPLLRNPACSTWCRLAWQRAMSGSTSPLSHIAIVSWSP
jgi:pyruvate, water dikinase